MRVFTSEYKGSKNKLRIKDAFKEDSGRGIIRMDPDLVSQAGLKTGDVIEISHLITDKRTAALLYPGRNEDKGSGIIRLDQFIRRNLDATIDDIVIIRKIETVLAERVTFAGLKEAVVTRNSQQLARILENRVIMKGDILSFHSSFKPVHLVVVDFHPKTNAVRIHLDSKITFSEKSHKEIIGKEKYRVSYEDIGGLDEEIQKLRETIELPFKHPEIFRRLNVDPPKGVILYGVPGAGKTLLARAVASETDAHFLTISSPEIMSKFYGQSEENLRKVFNEARDRAPSIIFIDKIDAIVPKNEYLTDKRIVPQLLTLMDGIDDRGQVIVIAETNRIDNIDEALRRPGRFDREIEIKPPDIEGRHEILKIHTRGQPLHEDVDLQVIAERTQGFVGADLKALIREAAILTMREILPKIEYDQPIPSEVLNSLQIKMEHFLTILDTMK